MGPLGRFRANPVQCSPDRTEILCSRAQNCLINKDAVLPIHRHFSLEQKLQGFCTSHLLKDQACVVQILKNRFFLRPFGASSDSELAHRGEKGIVAVFFTFDFHKLIHTGNASFLRTSARPRLEMHSVVLQPGIYYGLDRFQQESGLMRFIHRCHFHSAAALWPGVLCSGLVSPPHNATITESW